MCSSDLALAGCYALGLLDDQRLLVVTCKSVAFELFTYDVVTERRASIAVPTRDPECEVQVVGPDGFLGSCVLRDPAGRVWMHLDHAGRRDLVALDPTTLHCQTLVANWQTQRLLAWPDADTAIVRRNDQVIERVDLRSGCRTQLFPRFLAKEERR